MSTVINQIAKGNKVIKTNENSTKADYIAKFLHKGLGLSAVCKEVVEAGFATCYTSEVLRVRKQIAKLGEKVVA